VDEGVDQWEEGDIQDVDLMGGNQVEQQVDGTLKNRR